MSVDFLEELPLAQRLALSYSTARAREATLVALALDTRLAGILRNRSEVIIAQMKLAWWRDRLKDEPANWPVGEPLLARLAEWPSAPAKLLPLVDGWEALLAEDFGTRELTEFADGRAALWSELAEGLGTGGEGIGEAAREWALADLSFNLGDGEEAATVRNAAEARPWKRHRLPRDLRPLKVLHGLAGRALRRGSSEVLDGPGAAAHALRLGIAGG